MTLPADLADAVRADLETLSLVASRAGNAIMILGSDGIVQWANPSFHRLSGWLADASKHTFTRLERLELEGVRVLIVDDNATNRQNLEEMVSHWGMQATLCDGASSAMHELETWSGGCKGTPFDLVILDAMMTDVDGFQLAELIQKRPDLEPGTVMMLSSADRPNSTAKCNDLGIATYLLKPVSASALLEAILSTLEKDRMTASHKRAEATVSETAGSPLNEKCDQPLRVLIVDDHEPNRRLVESILQRRGHTVQSEADGDSAIDACCKDGYDVVLMDVQMPGRNGFSATRAIRHYEQCHGGHVPIVALTAHALQGDREKCLDAGMDSYLAKPIHAVELIEIVESVGSGSGQDFRSAANNATGETLGEFQHGKAEGFSIEAPEQLAKLEPILQSFARAVDDYLQSL